MSSGRSVCTVADIRTDNGSASNVQRLRMTLQGMPYTNSSAKQQNNFRQKPVGKAFALIPPKPANETSHWNIEHLKPTEEKVEIIKVYLEAKAKNQTNHEQNVKDLQEEVQQIQETCYTLTKFRENIAEKLNRKKSDASPMNEQMQVEVQSDEETEKMREMTKKLYARLQEAERKHQAEKKALEGKASHYRQELAHTGEALRSAKDGLEERDLKIEELQRLMNGMEQEHKTLLVKMKESEKELTEMRMLNQNSQQLQTRSVQLEKEVSTLREKIHHLDDMLKSQQRKVRQMIEQLEVSKTHIQEKDKIIQDLQEKVSFLEAENREMHDRMAYLETNQGASTSTFRSLGSTELLLRKTPLPSMPNKRLPLFRVVET
ncbi:tuftelin 1a [Latimeria chalumnae]|uniref:tuftelin 1a n=1 Tax=Latimeria chalumnae TaxID=7897 RepID=UPI0003C1745A|nr:PREDICTED: tuftelin [Latimeria chalumnae]|eukprot:XP_006006128.1 PREDICTED: tuftelin [Latimeria chalumnae]